MAITNKEILEAVEILKSQMPNGNIALLQQAIEDLQKSNDGVKLSMRELKKQLLDPDDGVVVRVNKNKDDIEELIGYTRGFLKKCETFESDIKECKKFKNGAHKALWVVYTSIIALATKLMFFNGD